METIPSQQSESLPKDAPVFHRYVIGALIALGFLGTFFVGVVAGKEWNDGVAAVPGEGEVVNTDKIPEYLSKDVDFQQFWDVWQLVKERSVHQPVSDVKMFYGAIAGMVGSLQDPYSVYFDPEYAEKFAAELAGTFSGIGAEIGIKNERLTVVAPLPGTPAEKAGIEAGDIIAGIDDVDTNGMAVDEAVRRIRGEEGTSVKLLIVKPKTSEPKEFVITRAVIKVDSVKWKTEGEGAQKVGVITVSHFNGDTTTLFDQAVMDLLSKDVKGIVLDLRNNPGGYLDAAVDMIGDWIPNGVAVSEKFSDGRSEPFNVRGSGVLAGLPTVVLVNGGSASASEIVAGALQDYKEATLVGEKTYGKGSVQDYIELDDTSALKLTIALWLTPHGRSIDKEGIAPDVVVERTAEDIEAEKDPQMDRALVIVRGGK